MVIPGDLLTQMPMLAHPSNRPLHDLLQQSTNKIFDVKWDGVRCLAYIHDGRVMLRNKRGVDITKRYPDVVAHLAGLYPDAERVFDGEIVVADPKTGKLDFGLALKRDAQSSERKIAECARLLPATYIAFDLLWKNDVDLRREPLRHRIAELIDDHPLLQRSVSHTIGPVMWDMVQRYRFEGLVIKDADSTYLGGRHQSWMKAKRLQRVTCIVTGYEPGTGAREGKVGALNLSLLRFGELVPVGKVGTGFKRRDHAPLLEVLNAHQQFLVEVEYLDVTSDGQLRHPSFKGVRSDVIRADCTLSQIGR